jgi:hypothetical protein
MRYRLIVGVLAAAIPVVLIAQQGQNGGLLNGGGPPQAKGKGKGKQRPPSRPTPHHADGRVNLGPLPGEKGLWNGNAGATFATNVNRGLDNNLVNLPTNLKIPDVPFLPWAREVYNFRQATLTKDDPHVRCKSSGGPRLYHTPYGFEIVDIPEMQQVFIMGVGGPHTWRVVYMDGRPHPADVKPTFHGHATGKWEGETLVVDSVGYNERFWLTREGIPHTSKLHLIERFTRPEYDTLRYEATIEDPESYTAPWSGGWAIPWNPNDEMYEYVCQENNRDSRHMFGGER